MDTLLASKREITYVISRKIPFKLHVASTWKCETCAALENKSFLNWIITDEPKDKNQHQFKKCEIQVGADQFNRYKC